MYACPECGGHHKTARLAKECCRLEDDDMAEEGEAYKCANCGEVYEDEWNADDCCRDSKCERINGYRCVDCSEVYDDQDMATECCNKSECDTVWYCQDCYEAHPTKTAAIACYQRHKDD